MSKERPWQVMRATQRGLIVGTAALGLVAGCSSGAKNETPERTTAPLPIQTSAASPRPEPSVSASPAATATRQVEKDRSGIIRKEQVDNADKGDVLSLDSPKIFTVARLPHIDGRETFIATYSARVDNKDRVVAIFKDARCVHDALEKEGELGPDGQGVWKPKKIIESAKGVVTSSKTAFTPYPIISLQEVRDKGVTYSCPPDPAGRIQWSKVPKDVAQLFGNIAKQVVEGLREGFERSPTPSRR